MTIRRTHTTVYSDGYIYISTHKKKKKKKGGKGLYIYSHKQIGSVYVTLPSSISTSMSPSPASCI